VMARLSRHGVRVLRTDRQGTLTVRAGADGDYELRTAR
jgi:beta-lactamase superfamily II metal-dependent hydrolase